MSIVNNKKVLHDYFVEEKIEAGLVLQGWEVKAVRAGRAQLKESYIRWKKGAFYLLGAHISPLISTSTHIKAEVLRDRKLLLHQREINKLIGKTQRSGYTLVPLNLHFKDGFIKVQVGLAKGKKQHDKRQTEKEKEWKKSQQRLLKEKQHY